MAGQLAKGFTLTYSTLVSKLIDISPSKSTRPKVKTTHQASGAYEEGIPAAFREPGPCTATIQWNGDENYQTLFEIVDPTTILITYPLPSGKTNAPTRTNTGWISSLGEAYKLGDLMMIDLEFEVTGGWTYTPASQPKGLIGNVATRNDQIRSRSLVAQTLYSRMGLRCLGQGDDGCRA